MKQKVEKLVNEVALELDRNILPFWGERMIDHENGGFYGQITFDGTIVNSAPKGAVLNTRMLWTFSAAYRVLGKTQYLEVATRAKDYLCQHFLDKQYGGIYWSVDHLGKPLDTKKQMYAIGFAIYGLSEYYRATKDSAALEVAIGLFETIEAHAYDTVNGGYFEALGRDWSKIKDMRLSEKDANESKTMNTHLHILEPYTNLYRVWKDPRLEQRIRELISIFTDKIIDPQTGHLGLFYDDEWNLHSNIISYGHDIEASWLLHESALVLDDHYIIKKIEPIAIKIAEAASEGIQSDGSIIYEYDKSADHYDMDRHWWPQAETVIGYFNIFQHFGSTQSLDLAIKAWEYTDTHMIDKRGGEWYWSIKADGTINGNGDKAGFWKCPYHNSRMCLELIERNQKTHKL